MIPNKKYITSSDFLFFKNEMLEDLKSVEGRISLKIDKIKNEFGEKVMSLENIINNIKDKIFTEKANDKKDDYIKEKFNSFQKFTEYVTDTF
jgi:hypothetical protein